MLSGPQTLLNSNHPIMNLLQLPVHHYFFCQPLQAVFNTAIDCSMSANQALD